MAFQPLERKFLPQRALDVTPEQNYWNSFELKSSKTHFGQVKCVDISPTAPHWIAVTAYDRVVIYEDYGFESITLESKLQDGYNCTRWRSDGKLLVTGANHPDVKVWDTRGTINRKLKGHKAPIHEVSFLPNKVQVFSASDDMNAKTWDIATGDCLATLQGHKDYVRSGGPHPSHSHLIATGSYDKCVCLWDTRTEGTRCVAKFPHQASVEAVSWHPVGSLLAVAAGNSIFVWDTIAGRSQKLEDAPTASIFDGWENAQKPLFSCCNHQKAIASLTYDENGSSLLTGGLDTFVKVFNTTNYSVVHTLPYPAPVQSIALSPNSRLLVVGMTDGKAAINVRYLGVKREVAKNELDIYDAPGGYLYEPPPKHQWRRRAIETEPTENDIRIEEIHRARLEPYDMKLRKFQYQKALDVALKAVQESPPQLLEENRLTVISLMEELFRRNGLRIALHRRNEEQLLGVLNFVDSVLLDSRFCSLMTTVLELIMHIYSGVVKLSPRVEAVMHACLAKVQSQVDSMREMAVVEGMLDCLIQANQIQREHREALRTSAPIEGKATLA
uniref:U3 small nucleolar RNA-associated protein 15 C-terminal domain-containing protein n=1 Tax=Eutreptiella gymnastica TaxID=73025 RepID=A0A7S4CAQ0_9EUGL